MHGRSQRLQAATLFLRHLKRDLVAKRRRNEKSIFQRRNVGVLYIFEGNIGKKTNKLKAVCIFITSRAVRY